MEQEHDSVVLTETGTLTPISKYKFAEYFRKWMTLSDEEIAEAKDHIKEILQTYNIKWTGPMFIGPKFYNSEWIHLTVINNRNTDDENTIMYKMHINANSGDVNRLLQKDKLQDPKYLGFPLPLKIDKNHTLSWSDHGELVITDNDGPKLVNLLNNPPEEMSNESYFSLVSLEGNLAIIAITICFYGDNIYVAEFNLNTHSIIFSIRGHCFDMPSGNKYELSADKTKIKVLLVMDEYVSDTYRYYWRPVIEAKNKNDCGPLDQIHRTFDGPFWEEFDIASLAPTERLM